jgi:hypothetical protein
VRRGFHAFLLLATTVALPAFAQTAGVAERLAAAELRWKRVAPKNYGYTFEYSAMIFFVGCGHEKHVVTVVAGANARITGCDSMRRGFGTIPLLFTYIREYLAAHPDEIEATFDPEFGFPTTFYVDPKTAVSDDHFTFSVSGFHVDR